MEKRVCIIDDDEAIREALRLLLFADGIASSVFTSADDFLASRAGHDFDCMLLDIRMPGTDGLDLFQILLTEKVPFPIIFITGHGDIPLAVRAIKQGAFDFLTKPFQQGELISRVQAAINHYQDDRQQLKLLNQLQSKVDNCTPRERDVMNLMEQGLSNKGIAEALQISPRTVEIHRAHVMEKMQAGSLPELVRMLSRIRNSSPSR